MHEAETLISNPQAIKTTEILIFLDRSGSMSSIKTATEAGIASFVRKNRELGGMCRMTLVQFDEDRDHRMQLETVYESCPLDEVPEFVFVPRGGTPFYDAAGITLNKYEAKWAKSPDRPDKVIVMIVTDGADISSKEMTAEGVQTIVERLQKEHSWEINYMGANHDVIHTAKTLGISATRAATYSASPVAVAAAFDTMAEVALESRSGVDTSKGPSLQARYSSHLGNTSATGVLDLSLFAPAPKKGK
jgi:hypothetical protein